MFFKAQHCPSPRSYHPYPLSHHPYPISPTPNITSPIPNINHMHKHEPVQRVQRKGGQINWTYLKYDEFSLFSVASEEDAVCQK